MIFIPMRRKNSSALSTFRGDTTKILLVGSLKYSYIVTLVCSSCKCSMMCPNSPLTPASSMYQGSVTQGCASWRSLM